MANPKKETFTSPAGKALYPKLQEADTKFKKEGEFSVKLLLSEADAAFIRSQCEEAQEAAFQEEFEKQCAAKPKMKPEKIAEGIKRADLPVKPYEDPETGDETGEWQVTFKTKASGTNKKGEPWERKVPLFDAKAQAITGKLPQIWSGSIMKVSYSVDPFCTAIGAGCTLRILAVQILQLKTGGARDAGEYGFGAEDDGYAYIPADDENDLPGGEGEAPFASADDNDDGQEDF